MGNVLIPSSSITLKDLGGGVFGSEPAGGGESITLTRGGYGTGNVGFIWFDKMDYDSLPNGTEVPHDDQVDNFRGNGSASANIFVTDQTEGIGGRSSIRGLKKCQIAPLRIRSLTKYMTWWQMWDVGLDDLSIFTQHPRSDKVNRTWDDVNGTETRISWTQQSLTYNPSKIDATPNLINTANVFSRFEMWVSAPNIDCDLDGAEYYAVSDFVDPDPTQDQFWAQMGYDMSNAEHIQPGETFNTWLAEAYSNPTRERVEISNSATWNGGEIERYIQTVSAWANEEISIPELYRGDFGAEEQLYAYVILLNGSVDNVNGDPVP